MHSSHHYIHQGLDSLIRSVSRVTSAFANVSSVFQLFFFLVVCGDMISKGFGLVAFFVSVKASSVCIHSSQSNQIQTWHKTPVIYPWCSSEHHTNSKIRLLAFFLVVIEYYNCYRDVSCVFNKTLIINTLFLKLSILNKHRIIISYLNRLPALFALNLVCYILFSIKK
jgi:hypothetical protein